MGRNVQFSTKFVFILSFFPDFPMLNEIFFQKFFRFSSFETACKVCPYDGTKTSRYGLSQGQVSAGCLKTPRGVGQFVAAPLEFTFSICLFVFR